jgi:hypothetical protein
MDFDAAPEGRAGRINRGFLATQRIGFTLNICCGTDRTGDVLVDVLPSLRPHIVGDLHHPPFRDGSFDTVICDPPFSYFNRWRWLPALASLAKRRVIISTPALMTHLPRGWHRKIYCIDTGHMFMRIWQVWTRDSLYRCRGGP